MLLFIYYYNNNHNNGIVNIGSDEAELKEAERCPKILCKIQFEDFKNIKYYIINMTYP